MSSTWSIRRRRRRDPLALVSPSDFSLRETKTTAIANLLNDPKASLYCLDSRGEHAWFVETPNELHIQNPAFFYQAQYEGATRLHRASIEELKVAAESLFHRPLDLTLVYSVGRCGSTWLSKIFHAAESCRSLSEPDVYTQLVGLNLGPARTCEWLRVATHLLCRAGDGLEMPWQIKFRSMAIEQAELMMEVFPQARLLFLYRGLETYVVSAMARFGIPARRFGCSTKCGVWPPLRFMAARMLARRYDEMCLYAPQFRRLAPDELVRLGPVAMLTLMWLSCVHRYLDLQSRFERVAAVRYEDLLAAPEPTLSRVFEFSGLSAAGLSAAIAASQGDSQRESVLSRSRRSKWELDDESQALILRLLHDDPIVAGRESMLPKTLA